MFQELRIRTSSVESLHSLDQVLDLAPEPLRNAHIQILAAILSDSTKLGPDLLLSQSIILKFLSCPGGVHMGREDVMQAELAGKYVHHHAMSIIGAIGSSEIAVVDLSRLCASITVVERKSVQGVFANQRFVLWVLARTSTYGYVSSQSVPVLEH